MSQEIIEMDKYNINTTGTKYFRFFLVGNARPISKKLAKELINKGARVIAKERRWMK